MKASTFKFLMNIYPPYWATGISVRTIAQDYRYLKVQMRRRWYNRNYVNTHFGGSLYAMVDPFYMLMLIPILGSDYVVWDKAATIDFIKPGRGTMTAEFFITDAMVADIIERTAAGDKYLPTYQVLILDDQGETVARVDKLMYIRKKRNSYSHSRQSEKKKTSNSRQ
jgi:acyl-coenzyme A thioesterase PaaI-like protein